MKNERLTKFEDFTNLYSLEKTLRFSLIPVEGTDTEYLQKIIREDERRAEYCLHLFYLHYHSPSKAIIHGILYALFSINGASAVNIPEYPRPSSPDYSIQMFLFNLGSFS